MPIGIKYDSGVSAQLKSAVIFAGLNSYGDTVIKENNKSRDHTENMLLNNPKVIRIKKKKLELFTSKANNILIILILMYLEIHHPLLFLVL